MGAGAVAVIAVIAVVVFLYAGHSSGSTTTSQTVSRSSTTSTTAGIAMTVAPVNGTRPSDFGMVTKIFQGTTQIPSFTRPSPINLGPGQDYTSLPGVLTFRGNNYRSTASYGTADVTAAKLQVLWSVRTGSIKKGGGLGAWTGSGWTGQPLIVKWPNDLKQIMNISPNAKAQPDLTEIIYPCEDGNIYFLNLKDGTKTRPTIVSGGGAIKGTGSIYPNGVPLLFTGTGDDSPGKQATRSRLYSLIDQKLMFSFGVEHDPNALRRWTAYDSSALFDAAADTIIEPGENGLLYTIKLNTQFDKTAGTLSINPDSPIKWRYTSPVYSDKLASPTPTARWLGIESSAVIWKHYAYLSDNGGRLLCVDLNTMQLVWVQNIVDDADTSPVLQEDPQTGTAYLYISTAPHFTAKPTAGGGLAGVAPVWKINAATGQIVWESTPYKCYSVGDVAGGALDTPVLGEHDISNLVIYAMARTPTVSGGLLVALDKSTGKEVWRDSFSAYEWSSPVAVYTPAGKSYIVACDSVGNMRLIEGTTGTVLDTINLGANIEASPAVFGDTIVVGTRGQKIFAVKIT